MSLVSLSLPTLPALPLPTSTPCIQDEVTYNYRQTWNVLRHPAGVEPSAADVVLIVDESKSMKESHIWLNEFVSKLDAALVAAQYGQGSEANRYGVVGFAGRGVDFRGRAIPTGSDTYFGTVAQAQQALSSLQLNGIIEDGYSAMKVALDSDTYPFRSSASKIFVLITDEDRDFFDSSVSRDRIQMMLARAGVQLHAVVNVAIDGGRQSLLGISNMSAFVIDSDNKIQAVEVALPGSVGYRRRPSTGHTVRDYVELALRNGGAAWDLEQLAMNVAAFTDALVKVSNFSDA